MNAIALLLGLLALSFLGSFLRRSRTPGGFGLPSGMEYLTLGVVLGPDVAGWVSRSTLETFAPLEQAALGWIALLIGVEFGCAIARRVPWRRLTLALVTTALVCSCITAATYGAMMLWVGGLSVQQMGLLAWSLGIVGAETTRYTVCALLARHEAHGPLSEFIADLSESNAVVPLAALGALFCVAADRTAAGALSIPSAAALTLALGSGFGLVAVLLTRDGFEEHEGWAALLGTSLLAIGLADYLDLAAPTVAFFMGLTLALATAHRDALVATIMPTEHSVLLPILLLAGAHLNLRLALPLCGIVVVALGTRVVAKALAGVAITLPGQGVTAPVDTWHGALLGCALLPSGVATVSLGLALALRFPGPVGNVVLLMAAASLVVGEFVGSRALRRVLMRAGEAGKAADAGVANASEVHS